MSMREQLHGTDKTNSKQMIPKSAPVVRRVRLYPGSQIPHDILQLHRKMGNRAVDRLLNQRDKGLIQRKIIQVGFDGSHTQSMFAGPGNQLTTSGLANCIAVVAWDTGGQGAVMRHYDTMHAYQESMLDQISGKNAIRWNVNALTALRNEMIKQLNSNVRALRSYRFAISLGSIWYDVDQRSATWLSRMNLLLAIEQVFGIEPVRAEDTATFDTTANTFI